MKKTVLVLLTTGLFAIAANAQDAPPQAPQQQGPHPMSKEDRAKMKAEKEAQLNKSLKDIGATDDQIQKVKDALEDSHKKHEELRKDASLSDDDKKEKNKEINEAQKAKLKEILGEEKAKQFSEGQRAMMKKMPPPPAAPPAPAP